MSDQLASEFQFDCIESNTEAHTMRILGLGIVLMVAIAAVSAKERCSCGFREGSNPCGSSGAGKGIKAQKLSRNSQRWVSVPDIKEAEKQRKALAERRVTKARTLKGCSGIAAIDGEHKVQVDEPVPEGGGLRSSELLALESKALITPRFTPVGDLCFPASSLETEHQRTIVVPAKPGRPTCSSCGGLQVDNKTDNHDMTKGDEDDEDDDVNVKNEEDVNERDEVDETSMEQPKVPQVLRTHRLQGSSSRGRKVYTSRSGSSPVSSAMRIKYQSPASLSKYSHASTVGLKTSYAADHASDDGQLDDSSNGQVSYVNDGHVDDSSKQLTTSGNYERVDSPCNRQTESFDYGKVDSTSYLQSSTFGSKSLDHSMGHARFGSHPILSVLGHENCGNGESTFDDFYEEAPGPSLSFAEQENIHKGLGKTLSTVPADPVSLAIAYRKLIEAPQHLAQVDGLTQGRERSEAESSLYFGHKKTPADGRQLVVERDVPEERLNIVDKPIVELKVQPFVGFNLASRQTENRAEQEALERERLEQEQATYNNNAGTSAYISYSDLGYKPAEKSDNTFVTRPPTSPGMATSLSAASGFVEESLYKPLGKILPGYKPGSVVFEGTGAKTRVDTATTMTEEEANDGYISEEDDDITTNCQQPGAVSQSSSQSNTLRTQMLSNSWSRAAKDSCPFAS